MAVRTREELMESIKKKIGDDTSDDTISFLEDIVDTFDDYDSRVNQGGDWKKKYEDNDREWREKYRDRFFGNVEDTFELDAPGEPETVIEKTRYEELFESKEE